MKRDEKIAAQKKKRKLVARIVGIAVVLLIMLVINVPSVLFFLKPEQKEAISLFNEEYFGRFAPIKTEEGKFDFLKIPSIIFMLLCCWAVYMIIKYVLSLLHFKNRRADTVKGLVENVVRYAVYIFAIVYGLSMLGADVLTVIAGLGILALVIGFGAQSLIEDIFSGLFIIFEGRFFVGDIISVDNFRGTVVSIGVVSTQLRDTGGNIRIINNSDIRTLTNLSDVTSIAVSIVSISYNASIPKAEEAIKALCAELPGMYPDLYPVPPRYLGVEELGESSVDLKVVADVEENNIYQARRTLNRELKLCLDEAGVEIPFPQVTVWYGDKSGK